MPASMHHHHRPDHEQLSADISSPPWRDLVKRHERTLHAQQYEALQLPTGNDRGDADSKDSPPSNEGLEESDDARDDDDDSRQHEARDPELPVDPMLEATDFGYLTSTADSIPFDRLHVPNFDPLGVATGDMFSFDGGSFPNLGAQALHPASREPAQNPFAQSSITTASQQVDESYRQDERRKRLRLSASMQQASEASTAMSTGQTARSRMSSSGTDFDPAIWAELFSLEDSFPMPDMTFMSPASDSSSAGQTGSLPMNAEADLSHAASRQPRKLFSRLPFVLREKADKPPHIELEETTYHNIRRDVDVRLSDGSVSESFPSLRDLRRFFSSYIDCFHRHFPIIHLPSLNLLTAPSPLILAMSGIGALYRLDRKRAHSIYHLSMKMMEAVGPTSAR